MGVALIATAGCSKKDQQEVSQEQGVPAPAEQGALPQGHPAVGQSTGDMAMAAHANVKTQKEVVLSDDVKAKWNEVKMEITDTSSKAAEMLTAKVGATVPLKKDGFKLKVEAFVPDYAIVEDHIESRSNEPKNPAVLVDLMDGDKTVARGWVFREFPEFNSYNNDAIHIALVSPGLEKPAASRMPGH